MNPSLPSENTRSHPVRELTADLCVVGGGLAGVCAAISAARAGLRVVLIHDRPVLGGNASSEVRLWTLGATSHMGNNNRWAREGGLVDEILVENMFRNPEGNPLVFDALLLDMVSSESRIQLLLDTAAFEVRKRDADTISSVRAFCPLDGTLYDVEAPLFADCSGDGVVGFLAGAAFRIGQEARCEFGELYAPELPSADLLGHSIYFMSKDLGRPVRFDPPSFALGLEDVRRIHRFRSFDAGSQACNFWWIEYGGHLDTIHESRAIKWELWRVAYGVWNYIKNSGEFPEAATLTLEWVGPVPGKRESRRFEGDVVVTQQDLIGQREHHDAVSFGGWAIDHHPVEGVFSDKPDCAQWHSKGVYQIPYRALYSRNISNLFLGGRLISASHIAFGSTRVMATCAHNGQAVGMAAAHCLRHGVGPRGLLAPERMAGLQRELLRAGQFIPGVEGPDPDDLSQAATASASSRLELSELEPNGQTLPLENAWAMLLPLGAGPVPEVGFLVDAERATSLRIQLRLSEKPDNFTPDQVVETLDVALPAGSARPVSARFQCLLEAPRYAFICLMENPDVSVHLSGRRVSGVLAVTQKFNKAVAKSSRQDPPPDSGIESFEFWIPQRRPQGQNFAIRVTPPLVGFGPENVTRGPLRPTRQPNAWVASPSDSAPMLTLRWETPQRISRVELFFDTDFDHPMESVIMGHPENVMPFVVPDFQIRDGSGAVLAVCRGNHQTRWACNLDAPVTTGAIHLEILNSTDAFRGTVFGFKCYA